MNSFVSYHPTKVVFGNHGVDQLGSLLVEQGCKKVMVVYGGNSAIKSGLLDQVTEIMDSAGIAHVSIGGVVPNPLLSKVKEGIALGVKEEVDLILAVGGGSVIDSSKAMGLGIFHGGEVWDFFEGKRATKGSIPIATILTLPAAGSEMSDSCVITKDEGMLKRYCGHVDCSCKFAIMDPMLTLTLPDYQTFCGATDILMHTMERYFNTTTNLDITDSIAEALLRSVMKNALLLKEDANNLEARWNVMWAGSLSHNGLTAYGADGGDWGTHDMEHELAGLYDVTHGAGLAAIWGSWARYVCDAIPHRFEKFAVEVMKVETGSNQADTIAKGIEEMEKFFGSIGMPISLTELGVSPTEEEFEEMGIKGTHFETKTIGSAKPLGKADIIAILKAAK
ncbi:MAG: iron-containing alcohol dehydrogenase [Lachnospiraceae bacterium]